MIKTTTLISGNIMKNIKYTLAAVILFTGFVFSQKPPNPDGGKTMTDTSESDNRGSDSGLQDSGATSFKTYLIDDFEDAGLWQGNMPRDQGIIRVQRREGKPVELADAPENRFVLGAKVYYFKSGRAWFSMSPPREKAIRGITKKLQIWVDGRNLKHKLKAVIRDFVGKIHLVSFGQLSFPGWNKLETVIPRNVVQDSYRLFTKDNPREIKFKSIVVDCSPDETFGVYYIYLDRLEAFTDVYLEDQKNQNTMLDEW